MATDLFILTNAKFSVDEKMAYFDKITQKLKAIPLNRTKSRRKGKWVEGKGDWSYYLEKEDDMGIPYFSIWFDGPYAYFPIMFPNICYIGTIYRYSTLYRVFLDEWVDSFRKNIYNIVTAVGGTEAIFVADNACNKLDGYLQMAWVNTPYETIKAEMIEEFGKPVTDYSLLDFNKLDYRNITEFILDDFNDL